MTLQFHKALNNGTWVPEGVFWSFIKIRDSLHPNFKEKNSGTYLITGYPRDYFKPNFRSLAPLVSVLHVYFCRITRVFGKKNCHILKDFEHHLIHFS